MKILNNPAVASVGMILVLLGAYAAVDAIDQHTEARLQLASAYREGCLPAPGETAIIVSDGRLAAGHQPGRGAAAGRRG